MTATTFRVDLALSLAVMRWAERYAPVAPEKTWGVANRMLDWLEAQSPEDAQWALDAGLTRVYEASRVVSAPSFSQQDYLAEMRRYASFAFPDWVMGFEDLTGSWSFTHETLGITVYATPWFDGAPDIPIQVEFPDGEERFLRLPFEDYQETLAASPDPVTAACAYAEVVAPFLESLVIGAIIESGEDYDGTLFPPST